MKNGQITLFIILGMVLLIAFAITWSLAGTVGKKETEQKQISQANIQPIKEYVQDCFDVSAKNGLKLLGHQGGFIYESQKGIIPDINPDEKGMLYNVLSDDTETSYLVMRSEGFFGAYLGEDNADYPWVVFPKVITPDIPEFYYGFYGIGRLPSMYVGSSSIKHQLEAYVANATRDCVNWNQFAGFNFTPAEPNVSMIVARRLFDILADRGVSFNLDWPVVLSQFGASTQLKPLTVHYPIRLAKMYRFVSNLLYNETTQIDFTPETAEYGVTIRPDEASNDDLIVVTAPEFSIEGVSYSFRFLRHNRRPAMHYVEPLSGDESTYCLPLAIEVSQGKLSLNGKATSALRDLNASDPDEDIPEFTFKLGTRDPAGSITINDPLSSEELIVIASDKEYDDTQKIGSISASICPEG